MSYGWNMVSFVSHAHQLQSAVHPVQPLTVCGALFLQTAVVPMMIQMTSDAAKILQIMPLPSYISRQLVLQVMP